LRLPDAARQPFLADGRHAARAQAACTRQRLQRAGRAAARPLAAQRRPPA